MSDRDKSSRQSHMSQFIMERSVQRSQKRVTGATVPSVRFVQVSNLDGQTSAEGRRAVRSHAAVQGWITLYGKPHPPTRFVRRQRPTPKAHHAAVGEAENAIDKVIRGEEDQEWLIEELDVLELLAIRAGTANPLLPDLAGAKLDPFDSLPIPHNPSVNMLLMIYLKRWIIPRPELNAPASPAEYTIKSWSMIQSSPAALTTHLLLAAVVFYAAERLSLSSPLILRLKSVALRVINKALAENMYTDDILISIIALCNSETFLPTGDMQETETHMAGLRKLVEIRGGLNNVNPYIARMITFYDKSIAYNAQMPRSFPEYSHYSRILRTQLPILDPALYLREGFQALIESGIIDSVSIPRLLRFHLIFEKLSAAYSLPHWSSAISSDEWAAAEVTLDTVTLYSELIRVSWRRAIRDYDIEECIRLVTLRFFYYLKQSCLPDCPTPEDTKNQIIGTVLNHVAGIFQRADIHTILTDYMARAFWWILCVMAICTPSTRERRVLELLHYVQARLRVRHPEESISILETFFFCGNMFGEQHGLLWKWMTKEYSSNAITRRGSGNATSSAGIIKDSIS